MSPSPNAAAVSVYPLNVSRKNGALPQAFVDSMKQIERWANSHIWSKPLPTSSFAAGWSSPGGVIYLIDPFGFVHLHGMVTNSSSPADNTPLLTLPPSLVPQSTWGFALSDLADVQISPNGTLIYRISSVVPSITLALDNCYYDPTV